MAERQENTKSQILGLLEVRKCRGLSGDIAIRTWVVSALECLLQAELERIEKRERDRT